MPDANPAASILCEPAQSKCTWTCHIMSQEAFCAEIYMENAKRPGYDLDWTPGLNTCRMKPSVCAIFPWSISVTQAWNSLPWTRSLVWHNLQDRLRMKWPCQMSSCMISGCLVPWTCHFPHLMDLMKPLIASKHVYTHLNTTIIIIFTSNQRNIRSWKVATQREFRLSGLQDPLVRSGMYAAVSQNKALDVHVQCHQHSGCYAGIECLPT